MRGWRDKSSFRNAFLLVAAAAIVASCSEGSDPTGEATPCPVQSPVDREKLLPDDVPIAELGRLVSAEVAGGYIAATIVSDDLIVAIDPPLQRDLLDAGYEILSHDNEGFEAEIFFARGSDTVGTILMREGPCPGEVTIKLRYTSKRYERLGA